MANFSIVVAVDSTGGIARDGDLPWRSTPAAKADMKYFVDLTYAGAVIMGRKTWDSLPPNSRPLPARYNVVISRQPRPDDLNAAVGWAESLDSALQLCKYHKVYVIGGAEIYREAMMHPRMTAAYVTRIDGDYDCDLRIDLASLGKPTLRTHIADGAKVHQYDFINCAEHAYLDLIRRASGITSVPSRTGIGRRRLLSERLEFPLFDSRGSTVPMLTTKFMKFDWILHELLWFLKGPCDTAYLREHQITIWDANTSREWHDKHGHPEYAEGDTGPIYGTQWRRWSARQHDRSIDQLQNVIDLLRQDPYTSRALVNAWNVSDLDLMALPPCHYAYQFVGDEENVDCVVSMRSGDIGLGIPYNAVSYAILTHLVARALGRRARTLVLNVADCHLYENHVDKLAVQLRRTPRRPPLFELRSDLVLNSADDIAAVTADDCKISQYSCDPYIRLEMAV